MPKAEFIVYKGTRILALDFSGSKDMKQNIATIKMAQEMAMKEPLKSLRLLTDATDVHYTTEGVNIMKEFSKTITPHVKASAAIGIDGLRKIIVQSIIRLSGRDIRLFDTREEALEWLTEQ